MSTHLIEEAVDSWVDVSEHLSRASLLGKPVEVSFARNDVATGGEERMRLLRVTTLPPIVLISRSPSTRRFTLVRIGAGRDTDRM
jgi:hypothetical protein